MNSPQRESTSKNFAGLARLVFQGGALMIWTLAAWSLTASLSITGSFAAGSGMMSNWIFLTLFGTALWFLGKLVERELLEHPVRMPRFAWARRSHSVPPDDSPAAAA
jgi:hypothetical protein